MFVVLCYPSFWGRNEKCLIQMSYKQQQQNKLGFQSSSGKMGGQEEREIQSLPSGVVAR